MTSNTQGEWTDVGAETAAVPGPAVPPLPPPAEPRGGLKSMISDAMSKSRGQGVVQGSTLFFKNLAESVAHSNRNLKIGLAFLTASFVVVASGLGWLTYQSFRTQVETKASLEKQYSTLSKDTQKILEPFMGEFRGMQERLERSEKALEAVRLNAEKEADAAREEVARVKAENEQLKAQLKGLQGWMDAWGKELSAWSKKVEGRIDVLEAGRR